MHYLADGKNARQMRFDESKLTVSQINAEMHGHIDWESKRSNVDGSKKRAVMQHMDYDGFR